MAQQAPAYDHRDAITLFARMDYAARGVVYLLVGGLAAFGAYSVLAAIYRRINPAM